VRTCLLLATALLAAPAAQAADEAMIYGYVYECHGEAINKALVEMCTSRFPQLGPRAAAALAGWRERSKRYGKLRAEACGVLDEYDKKAERAESIDYFKATIMKSFQGRVDEEGESGCASALRDLERDKAEVERRP
jgi:hypothetical protein